MTVKRVSWVVVGAVLAYTGVASAGLIVVEFTGASQGVWDNMGFKYQPIDMNGELAALMLTSRFEIDPSSPFDPFALGSMGTVVIDDDGTGVQDERGDGNDKINADDDDGDEELVLTFDNAVPRDNLVLGLTKFDAGNGFLNKDDPAIFVFFNDGTFATFDETHIVEGDDHTGTLFLNELLPMNAMVEMIVVRETNKDIVLGSVQFIPAPGALALLGLGALARRRRRRFA